METPGRGGGGGPKGNSASDGNRSHSVESASIINEHCFTKRFYHPFN